MASASKTPNLNLPQWVDTEKPERTDFNAAFDAIDTTVASHMAEKAYVLKDTDDLQTILNSGERYVALNPEYNYSFNGINLPSNTKIFGNKATITSPNTTAPIFNTNGNSDILIQDISFVAATADPNNLAMIATDKAIVIENSYRVTVNNCSFENFLGCGIDIHGLPAGDVVLVNKQIRHIITRNRFVKCYMGLVVYDQAEYSIIADNTFTFCRCAIWSQAGSNAHTGNSIANCRAAFVSSPDINGIVLNAGVNRQHGSVVGCIFNHCRSDQANVGWDSANFTINGKDYQGVWIDGTDATYPPTFTGNTMYYTDLTYLNANVSGIPIWNISGCVFSRMTISSSHAGTLFTVACTEVINVTKTNVRARENFYGCLVKKTSNQSITNLSSTSITWQQAEYGDFWNASNPSRLTVPAGAKKVRVIAAGAFAENATGRRHYEIIKNTTVFPAGRGANYINPAQSGPSTIQCQNAILDVTPGDYFEVVALQASGGSLDLLAATTTWFSMEVIE